MSKVSKILGSLSARLQVSIIFHVLTFFYPGVYLWLPYAEALHGKHIALGRHLRLEA